MQVHSVPSLKPLGPGMFQDLKFFRFQQGEMVLNHSLYIIPGQVWDGTFWNNRINIYVAHYLDIHNKWR